MSTFTHNVQTLSILDLLQSCNRLIVDASPGTGKTTAGTNVIAKEFSQKFGQFGISLVFATRNKADNERAMREAGLQALVSTVNAFGWQIVRTSLRGVKLHAGQRKFKGYGNEPDKLTEILENAEFNDVPEKVKEFAKATASNGKSLACFMEVGKDDAKWERAMDMANVTADLMEAVKAVAIRLLQLSDAQTHILDFDDQCRFPVLLKMPVNSYDWLIVDEYQDINPAQRLLLEYVIGKQKAGFPVGILGDEKQSVYDFRGADTLGMKSFADALGCSKRGMSICYRCSQAVCNKANEIYADSMQWHESTGIGSVGNVDMLEFKQDNFLTSLSPDTFILCRNNAPLAKVMFALIRNGIKCHYQGGIKLADSLTKRVNASAYRNKGTDDLILIRATLIEYLEEQEQKCSEAGKNPAWLGALKDEVDVLCILIEGLVATNQNSKKMLLSFIRDCFTEPRQGDVPRITLATYHGSKGLQRTNVYLLGDAVFCPSPYAESEQEKLQETNLKFVAWTRAKSNLYFIDGSKDEF
jgi:superfamily I DNA/RNA helicase